jgi:hypothetical protein
MEEKYINKCDNSRIEVSTDWFIKFLIDNE